MLVVAILSLLKDRIYYDFLSAYQNILSPFGEIPNLFAIYQNTISIKIHSFIGKDFSFFLSTKGISTNFSVSFYHSMTGNFRNILIPCESLTDSLRAFATNIISQKFISYYLSSWDKEKCRIHFFLKYRYHIMYIYNFHIYSRAYPAIRLALSVPLTVLLAFQKSRLQFFIYFCNHTPVNAPSIIHFTRIVADNCGFNNNTLLYFVRIPLFPFQKNNSDHFS